MPVGKGGDGMNARSWGAAVAVWAVVYSLGAQTPVRPPTITPPRVIMRTPGQTSVTAKASASGSPREAARWLVANGGVIRIVRAGKELEIKSEREVPVDRFQIVELNLDRWNSAKPQPEETDFETFSSIRGLRKVWLRALLLPDASFAFLASNPDLAFINLEGNAALTDAVLPHLAGLRKVEHLGLTGAPGVTGKGFAGSAWLTTVKHADFLGLSLEDVALKALGGCAQLEYLRISKGSFTDDGLAALGRIRTLARLNLEGGGAVTDAGFAALFSQLARLQTLSVGHVALSDQSAAALAKLPQVTTLDLSRSGLTDVGLMTLAAAPRLRLLNVRGSKVTADGLAAFARAAPKCQLAP